MAMATDHVPQQPDAMVHSDGDQIVVTVTLAQAQAIAASIATADADRDDWLSGLASALSVEAGRRESARVLSRGSFLLGRWGVAKVAGGESQRSRSELDDALPAAEPTAAAELPAAPTGQQEPATRATVLVADARALEVQAGRAVQHAATVQLRVNATASRAGLTSSRAAVAAAEDAALAAAAVARAVADAAAQAASGASIAAEVFESEVSALAAAAFAPSVPRREQRTPAVADQATSAAGSAPEAVASSTTDAQVDSVRQEQPAQQEPAQQESLPVS
jgi:hypothetical protein